MGKKLTLDEFLIRSKKLHNDKYDYSFVEDNFVNSYSKVRIICPVHGEFEQAVSSHLHSCGCPACARIWSDEHKVNLRKSLRRSRGMTTEQWIERAKAVHGAKYDYSKTVYINQRTDVIIICSVHGEFTQKADSHIRGFGCRLCGLQSDKHNGKHNWSDEQRKKIAVTCLERYGAERYLDSDVGKKQMDDIRHSDEFRNKLSAIISSDEVQNKMKNTSIERYGVAFAAQTKEVQQKIYRTKKSNHTVNSSKSEVKMYGILCGRFGSDDIVHQYGHDKRYPYVCDFYVKSLDLFIELNASWTHGGHWFGSCSDDNVTLEKWIEKSQTSDYYKAAIQTWTIRDVKKLFIAKKNNLNYLVFWKNDLSDFCEWIQSDILILNNIQK